MGSSYEGPVRIYPVVNASNADGRIDTKEAQVSISDLDYAEWRGVGLERFELPREADAYRVMLLDGDRNGEMADAAIAFGAENYGTPVFRGKSGFSQPGDLTADPS